MLLEEKLGIQTDQLPDGAPLLSRLFELGNVYRFLELPEKVIRIEQFNSSASRAYYANALERSVADLETLKNILNKKATARGYNEKSLYVYREAEEFLLKQQDRPLSVSLLEDLHKQFSSTVNKSTEDFDLFTIQYHKLPEDLSPSVRGELEELFALVNASQETDPVALSWLLHFELLRIKPFGTDAPILARLLQYFWLTHHKLTVEGLLTLEHELLLNRHTYFALQLDEPLTAERLNSIIEFGYQVFDQNLGRIRHMLRNYFRKQVEYEDASPRQRNMMNYVFENGYKLNLYSQGVLNKRQELIMYIIQHKGVVSTKELTEEFGCNRKTIQRDFTDLLQLSLVRTIGNGSSLRYAVSLKNNTSNPYLEFLPDFIRRQQEAQSCPPADDNMQEQNPVAPGMLAAGS